MSNFAQRLEGLSPAKRQLLQQRLQAASPVAEPIAIVGMACRFAGAADVNAYWRLIRDGIDATGEIPATRWDVDALFDPAGEQPGKMSVRWAGMLDEIDRFDPQFFGISPREASRMDPQQRLLLEVAWEALEIAAISPARLAGTKTGVFIGIGGTDYSKIPSQFENYYEAIDAHVGTGNALSIAANRLSYFLDLRGPSVAVDTACSSGLMGIHLAVQSLRGRECDTALAGGVNAIVSPETTIAFSKARMLSPDGRCRPFDAEANGYVRGEGCAVVVLKRLTDAVRDGDNVLAVLRATAANQDGRTSGITAPSGPAQQAVIRAALNQAGLTSDRISYIEAHGTGTPLGDPIEMQALTELFRNRSGDASPCYITSVKANIGHTETVSGVAGLIKVVLMLQHRLIPAQLHLQNLNPHVSLTGSRLQIPTQPIAWQVDMTRIAGVSSFGFGGTNTHVLVEEAAPHVAATIQGEDRPLHLLTLSAKTPSALATLAGRYADFVAQHPQLPTADISFSSNTGRQHFGYRATVVARDNGELCQRLCALRDGSRASGTKTGHPQVARRPKIAFLFTGQGSQYVGMGRRLFESQPSFRNTLLQCDEILRDWLDTPLLDVVFGAPGDNPLLDQTLYTQPALFALEYSLATLWQSWGVQPSAVMGHSVGEYVAACVAGVFSLEDGLWLIARRARLMQQLPHDGLMAVVFAGSDVVEHHRQSVRDEVSIAAANGPDNTVVSGDADAVRDMVERLAAAGVRTQLLTVSHAFHSPKMDPLLDDFQAAADQVTFHQPQRTLVSNLTGRVVSDQRIDAAYWRRHVRDTVQFAAGMNALAELGLDALLEIGPTASLLGMGRRCLPNLHARWLPSLRQGQDEWLTMLDSLAELYLLGANVDWRGFDRDYPRRKCILPTYPFERERYWFDASQSPRRGSAASHGPLLHPLLGSHVPSALATRLFEANLSCRSPKYLIDHQVQGSPVFPAAGYVEQALAAAEQVFGPGPHLVENLTIQQAMFLPEGARRTVQLTVAPETGGHCQFDTFSSTVGGDSDAWSLHATGELRHRDTAAQAGWPHIDVQQVRQQAIDCKMHPQIYQQLMPDRGLVYGPAFQLLESICRTDTEALGEVHLPAEVAAEADAYHLHPALGDALFQSAAGIIPPEPDGSYSPYTYMPTSVRSVRLTKPLSAQQLSAPLYTYAVRRSTDNRPSPESVEGDVYLIGADGEVLVEMAGLKVQRVGRAQDGRVPTDVRDWLYQVTWESAPLAAVPSADAGQPQHTAAASEPAHTWLVLADRSGIADALADRLGRSGDRCVLVYPGDRFERLAAADTATAERYCVPPLDGDAYRQRLEEAFSDGRGRCDGVVHLSSLDIGHPENAGTAALADAARRACGSALQWIRQLSRFRFDKPPTLWLATRGAQQTGEPQANASQADGSLAQSPLWGLGRVAAVELPELDTRLLDFDSADDAPTMAAQLQHELAGGDGENQLAYRAGMRLAARLRRTPDLLCDDAGSDSHGDLTLPTNSPYRLRLGAAGSFDSLRIEPAARRQPEADQVELQVHAAGLNFSDVLKAMGLYPGLTDPVVPLGIECSGVVTAVGPAASRFRIGDAVMGVAPFSFASHAITAQWALVAKPPQITDAEAATIPITFLTAYHALVRLAQLQPGERVLIHAAAGGVGLAAIQIAQQIGAEIFATAGSDEKRQFLRDLGIDHLYSSRTTEFAEQILSATGRQGVDVVLNSLSGEAITAGLGILRAYGRFLEIGKTDIYQNRRIGLLPFQDNLSYFAIDLDRMLRQRPQYVSQLFADVMEGFQQGVYQPLARTEFPMLRAVDAFRYMAQRKNIGKVVVRMDATESGSVDLADEASQTPQIAPRVSSQGSQATRHVAPIGPEGSYLVTGGLGALGLRIAQWLAAQHAKHVVLLGRRPASKSAAVALDALRADGVEVAVLQADVADRQSLAAALAAIPQHFPPLRGVIHAAGVLDDGLLLEMSLEQFQRPLEPKILGAWNLHELTRDLPLDFFVLFSSVASLLGSPGQANYAAGNAYLDALASYRRQQGLPALSVNWGPWAGAGMATGGDVAQHIRSRGMDFLPAEQALDLLTRLLTSNVANVAVMDAHWSDMARRITGRIPPLLADVIQQPADQDATGDDDVDRVFVDELRTLGAEQRAAKLRGYFADELARIMGLDADHLDVAQPLNQIGMDSLLALELKTNLERRLAIKIPMGAFMEGPSVTSLAEHVAQAMFSEPPAGAADAAQPGSSPVTWSPLVTLQSAGNAAPLFLVHPLGGNVNCYRELASHLTERPVYALCGRGSDGQLPPQTTMPEMLDTYVQAIRSVQPHGPYNLAGWSAGGIFCYALSRALRAQGESVASPILIDTPLPSIYDQVHLDDDVEFLFELANFANWFAGSNIDVQGVDAQWRTMDDDARWQLALQIAKAHGVLPPGTSTEHIRRVVDAAKAHAKMIRGYAVEPFDQTVHLIRPEQPDVLSQMTGQSLAADLGWRSVLGDRIQLHESSGDHFSMLAGHHADRLAATLIHCLEWASHSVAVQQERVRT